MKQLTGEIIYNCIKRTGESNEEHSVLIREHAMDIYIGGEFYTSVVCTDEWLSELVIGRLICDGMIRSVDEVKTLVIAEDRSVVDVEMSEAAEELDSVAGASGGSFAEGVWYPDEWLFAMADTMAAGMPLHEKTWSTHSCFLFMQGELLFSCEDISRHNAVDKVIGYAVKNRVDLAQCAVYSSGRVPVDMIDKIVVAGMPVLVSKGMPTLQAVELARKAGITLVCGARKDQMKIYTDYREYKWF